MEENQGKDQAFSQQPQNQHSATERTFEGFIAEIVEIVGRTGIYGEARQFMCKILEGPDKGRVIRRNVRGRVKVGDRIRLPDTTREMKQIKAK